MLDPAPQVTGSVLIVDDDEDTAMLVADGLRRRGLETEAVTSGQACLESLRSRTYDVVVTDIEMPGLSGVELRPSTIATRICCRSS